MSKISRRDLLKLTVAGAAGASAVPYLIPRNVLAADGKPGANDRITIGAIGVGGRGRTLLEQLPEEAEVVALCDCNRPRAKAYKARSKGTWPIYLHHQKLLERKDIDAVIIATGEFQRVLPCIHACQAGKDIYAEKPLTLYIREGRVLVDSVRKTGRVFQVGTQQRSMNMNRVACELVRTGGLGKIKKVLSRNFPGPEEAPAEGFPERPVPDGLEWDIWLNQAAMRPFNRTWMRWMRWYDFAGGDATNWGAHAIDQIQWGLGADGTGPVKMKPLTPGLNGQVEMRYADGVPVEFTLWPGPHGGCIFVCEKGKLEVNRNKFTSNPKEIAEELRRKVNATAEEEKWQDPSPRAKWQARWHMQNWLDCIRTREKPVADVEIGHRSITVSHLLNITRRIGRPLEWDPAKEQFVGDDEANKLVERPRRKGYELPELT